MSRNHAAVVLYIMQCMLCLSELPAAELDLQLLPDDFIVGAGTSAYQCEGAWDEDGKGEGMFDHLTHSGLLPVGTATADVAADSYHRYKEDVAAAHALKLQMYRISLSWPRLLPTGRVDRVNLAGLRYYIALLDELHASGIEPMVTLFHFDSPQALMDEFGGWESDKMVDAFVDFARFAFANFGDRVRYWTTFNEPYIYCAVFMRMSSWMPPVAGRPGGAGWAGRGGRDEPGKEGIDYECLHRHNLAHARAYALYRNKFAATQKGRIGLTNIAFAPRPNSTRYADVAAARRHNLFTLGTTLGPLTEGDFPAEVRRAVAEASRAEGLPRSRLPNVTAEESSLLRGSLDFIGLNLYYGQVVAAGRRPDRGYLLVDAAVDILENDLADPGRDPLKNYKKMTPWGLREAASWLWDEYRLPIFVTENGYVMKNDERSLDDHDRAVYHSAYMRELLKAVHEDGVRVLGYLAWSLIDVFEWVSQYKHSFGLVHVDYGGGSLNRTLKRASSEFFLELAATRRVPVVEPSPAAAAAPPSAPLALLLLCWGALHLARGPEATRSFLLI